MLNQDFVATATIDHFTPLIESSFTISKTLFEQDLEDDVVLVLAQSEEMPQHPYPNKTRDSFSLMFKGPMATLLLQGTYPLQSETLGEFPLFLVPLGEQDGAMYYQAIIS